MDEQALATRGTKTNRYNALLIAFAALGSTTYGYCASVIGSTIGQPGWYSYFDLPLAGQPGYATKTTPAIATANGVFSAGGAVGTLFIIWSAEALGRKRSIQIGALFAVLGGALQGGAATLGMFQAGRFFAGLGIGILVTIVPMYISEMSHPTKRGWLVGNHAIFLVFGYMLSSWVGFGCYFATSVNESFAWRFPLCLQVLFPAVLLAGSPLLPRSPRWLLSKDRVDEAWAVVQRIRADPNDPEDIVAKEEFYQIREQIVMERKKFIELGRPLWQAVWTKKSYRKRMMIGFMTQWGAEFCGPLIINNYAVILYTSLGATGYMPLLLSALWLTTAGLIYNPGGAWLQDRVNSRRGMLLVGTAGCLFCTTMLVVCSAVWGGTTNKVGNGFGIFFIFLYLAFQGTGQDTTMYLYVSEIFPLEIRGIGMGFSLFGQFAATIILLETAPIGFVNVSWKYYFVIIAWCPIFMLLIYFFWPETAQLSLEEISKRFGDDVAIDITGASIEDRTKLDEFLKKSDIVHAEVTGTAEDVVLVGEKTQPSTV